MPRGAWSGVEGGRATALVTPAGNHGRIRFTHK